MQGPYDTMLHGCGRLLGEVSNQVQVAEVNNLTRVGIRLKLPETLTLSSYLRHAATVQNSSGAMLGCGRIETLSPVAASYQGRTTFTQFTQILPPLFLDTSNLEVLSYNVLESVTCSSRAAIFDPWIAPRMKVGSTPDQFPVGDLSSHPLALALLLFEVSLIGSGTIVGHVVSGSTF